ncbi:dTDP-4-dehydrorhamnose reductase [Pseudochrobactrum sp. B5]|uniref:dTDP-4-dehydrorhamnose reductase n=1 Tax=Pseudochrobactrum sp. B5 TaxID=1289478 RepID=UPI00095221FA|nr:dTDP-4-dehydrorhamnose reductase [Pseudochrobactrum sp. B5]
MRIVVTGKCGQVVRSMLESAHPGVEIVALGRPELDLAAPETIYATIANARPDIVVSAAAYTAVDKAEDEPALAYAVNAAGAGAVAQAAAKLDVPVIHISTDYVFDGNKLEPYTEMDEPNPQSVYGASKLAGEQLVAEANTKHIILRTAWVYSPYGNNFLKTMLRLGRERDEISVVSDQHGNPTSAANISSIILTICHSILSDKDFHHWGIYHLVDDSETTWFNWAEYIFTCASLKTNVKPIKSIEYTSKAKRPNNSRLSNDKLKNIFANSSFYDWKSSTDTVIGELVKS